MKKVFLFLAGSAIMFASCGPSTPENQAPSKAQIDSTVAAEMALKEAAAKAAADSAIVAAAKASADSAMIAKDAVAKEQAKGGGKSGKTTKTTKTTTTVVAPPPPPPPPVHVRPGSDNGGAKNVNDRSGAH